MTIGAAWNTDDPKKPWADWDPDANIPIPIGLDGWLAELGTTYGSHTVIAASPLLCVDAGSYNAGVIRVRMSLVASPVYTPGRKYPFTIRVVGADGITKDDRTWRLKVQDR